MGKVRSVLIKRAAKKLNSKYPQQFAKEFGKNKEALAELGLTKRLRNRIAGYISATKRERKIREEPPVDDY